MPPFPKPDIYGAIHAASAAQPAPTSRTKKRKRKRKATAPSGDLAHGQPQLKQRKTGHSQAPNAVKHALLAQFYPTTLTLRRYVLNSLPASSRLRRKKIAAVGTGDDSTGAADGLGAQLATLLDTTLVGLRDCTQGNGTKPQSAPEDRLQQWIEYSQREDSRVTLSGGDASAIEFQSEIVDFIIWLLFSREKRPGKRPKNLLCDGFRKNGGPRQQGAPTTIQGILSLHFNERVTAMKRAPWPQLLQLLGKSGESVMINLLLDCSIFLPVESGQGNYYQLSGTPIFECEPLRPPSEERPPRGGAAFERKPTDIIFVRSRMLYARAALNARGLVNFGLRHIHALNRFPLRHGGPQPFDPGDSHTSPDPENTLRMMMYIFPRQFGLHNAFTSNVDPTKTAHKFLDYTLREEEIFSKFPRKVSEGSRQHIDTRIPKRLRDTPEHLVQRLQTLHARCSYVKLLQHHCPDGRVTSAQASNCHSSTARTSPLTNKPPGKSLKGRRKSRPSVPAPEPRVERRSQYASLLDLAIPLSNVSAYCRAVLWKIIPHQFWGTGDVQRHNLAVFQRNIDRFVRLRRFETFSLHEAMQGLKITEIEWLEPPGLKNKKCSRTDLHKRNEIFSEFVYYAFDSLLIPLIRSNFYVTESNVHRYRLFYFRHDVWRSIAEPAMAELKAKMFEEVKLSDALAILDSRRLGYSQIRLLPKQSSVRPIMNLRRRQIVSKDKKLLGPSINSILGPVANMLKLERNLHPDRLGSAMFSVGDIYERIGSFKRRLGSRQGPFYFVKVDVQAAFDTIPQEAIIDLMETIPSEHRYEIIKHVEVAPHDGGHSTTNGSRILKRWHSSAKPVGDAANFLEMLGQPQLSKKKRNAVYVDSVFRKTHGARDLLRLTSAHVQQNLVRIGKKFYRQRRGIPQGSVLSTVLCSYFYADLERKELDFIRNDGDALLLRLIDDFLLITTDRTKATRFISIMQRGLPDYGVAVSPLKTLANFPLISPIDNSPVPILPPSSSMFPYCGTQINTHTLELTRDRASPSRNDPTIANALTVEYTRHPGQTFRRKVLAAFRLQSHAMFFDSRHNSPQRILRNLRDALVETATKAWAYARCLPREKRPAPTVWTATVEELAGCAYMLLAGRSPKKRWPGYLCRLSRFQVRWLTLGGFREVLGRKAAAFGQVLKWLDGEMAKLETARGKRSGRRSVVAIKEASLS